jgi:hypothetical protein
MNHFQTTASACARQSWAGRGAVIRQRVHPSKAAAVGPSTQHSTLAPPEPIRAHLLDDRRMQKAARQAAAALSSCGYCLCLGGLDASVVQSARGEVGALFRHGAMQPGSFTVGGQDNVVTAKRDDHTMWLHEYLNAVGGPEKGGATTITALDERLSRFGEAVAIALSELDRPEEPMSRGANGGPLHYAGRTDLMLACYPGGGAAYGPHVDNLDGDGRGTLDYGRCWTLVYYLNDRQWDAKQNGGELRVHLSPTGGGAWPRSEPVQRPHEVVDIPPRGDSLIIFRADKVLHEVRPARAPRYAATLWLYGGGAPCPCPCP